jgi:hypothetical protein
MADAVYNSGKGNIAEPLNFGMMLVKSTYSFDPDHDRISDIVASECDFSNYTRKLLTGEIETIDNANDRVEYDANNPTVWTSAGNGTNNTIGGAVLYDETGGTDATRVLLAYYDTGFPVTTDGNDLSIVIHAQGLIQKT